MALTKDQERGKRYFQIYLFNDDIFEKGKNKPQNIEQLSSFNFNIDGLKACLKELKNKNTYTYKKAKKYKYYYIADNRTHAGTLLECIKKYGYKINKRYNSEY